jgi:hypothetical protein
VADGGEVAERLGDGCGCDWGVHDERAVLWCMIVWILDLYVVCEGLVVYIYMSIAAQGIHVGDATRPG